VGTFERHTEIGRLPPPESMAVEGVFYKFNFPTGEEREQLFVPVFSTALAPDPLSGKNEYFICSSCPCR